MAKRGTFGFLSSALSARTPSDVALVILGTLLFLVALAVSFKRSSGEQAAREVLAGSLALQNDARDLKYQSADLNGWQTAYALEWLRVADPKKAIEELPTRKAYMRAERSFVELLESLSKRNLSEVGARELSLVQDHFRNFVAMDRLIVERYQSASPDDQNAATDLVLGPEIVHFESMVKAINEFVAFTNERAQAAVEAEERILDDRRVVMLILAGAAVFVSIALALVITHARRTNARLLGDLEDKAQSDARSAAIVKLLQDVAMAANAAENTAEAMLYALKRVCAHTGWSIGHYYCVADDSSGELVSSRVWHFDEPERYAAFREASEQARFRAGIGLPGRVFASGKAAWIADVSADSNYPRAKWMSDKQVRAGFGVPVTIGAETVGVLEFYSKNIEPDDALLTCMSNLGVILGRVVERTRAEAFQTRMFGIVSHDLKTPLTAMTLNLQTLILLGHSAPGAKDVLQRLQATSARMTRIVRDLLDQTSARARSSLPVDLRKTDFDALCRALLAEVAVSYPNREIRYTHEGSSFGTWDPDRLAQLMQNLLSNALKYSPDGAAVDLTWTSDADELRISVHNSGEPIDPESVAFIFEPFRRGTLRNHSGSVGLGLYIANSVVRAHGGTITVNSTLENGTTFEVHLPKLPGRPGSGRRAPIADAS